MGIFLVAVERPHRNLADAHLLSDCEKLVGVGEPEHLVGLVVHADHRRHSDHAPELARRERGAVESAELSVEIRQRASDRFEPGGERPE